MNDVWDEKPEPTEHGAGWFYWKSDMDAWLEKLNAETDNKDEIITRLLRNTVSLKEKLEAIKKELQGFWDDEFYFSEHGISGIRKIIESSEFTTNSEGPPDIEDLGLTEKDVEDFGKEFLKNVDELAEIDES